MNNDPSSTFHGLGIAPRLLEILAANNFQTPTPIQLKAIPSAIEGKDLIGIAQTGTGKTLAFTVPMLQNLARVKGQGLILLPTRELAAQVEETLRLIGRQLGIRTAIVVGGASAHPQIAALRKKPHVIVATPGRLIDHLQSMPKLLEQVSILILDEADRMLDMGFAPQIEKILARVPKQRQTLLFSATMPTEIVDIARKHMATPTRVEIARPGSAADHIDQEVIFVSKNGKLAALERLLRTYHGSVLVFSRTKWGTKKLARDIKKMGHEAAEIHSNRTLGQRKQALEGFKNGRYRVLVATDIAARGIDVNNIELVVNYDLPSTPNDYVHRIGRTARAGKQGMAISLAMPDQQRDIRDIERLIRMQIRVTQHAQGDSHDASKPPQTHAHTQRPRSERHDGQGQRRNHAHPYSERSQRHGTRRKRPRDNRHAQRRGHGAKKTSGQQWTW